MSVSTAPKPASLPMKNGVVVVDGYNATIRVERSQIVIADGIFPDRREGRFSRHSGLRRLVVPAHTGMITLPCVRFLDDIGASLVVLDEDYKPITVTAPSGPDLPRLRRAQVLAAISETGLDISRFLIGRKLRSGAGVLRQWEWPEHIAASARSAADAIEAAADGLGRVHDIEHLRVVEARCAALYWDCLEHVSITWARGDRPRIPAWWRTWGNRRSRLSGSNRAAINPANAMANYCYRLLEIETTLACQAAGLDPALDVGLLHVDKEQRVSLASTIMEAARADVDLFLMGFFTKRPLRYRDFHEIRTGQCRILAPLTHELATDTLPRWRTVIGPVVQAVVDVLLESPDLAALKRLTSRAAARVAPTPAVPQPPKSRAAQIPWCSSCGPVVLTERLCRLCEALAPNGGVYCSDACKQAALTLAQLGEQLQDPLRRTPQAWTILWPALQRVPLHRLQKAAGISKPWASMIRSGRKVPNTRLWPALCRVGDLE